MFKNKNAAKFSNKFSFPYTSLYKPKFDPPSNLSCVNFFMGYPFRVDTRGNKVFKNHGWPKKAEKPLWKDKLVPVLPGYDGAMWFMFMGNF